MKKPKLMLLKETFGIHRLPATAHIPVELYDSPFFSVTRTFDEVSIVVPEEVVVPGSQQEGGWACMKVQGPLDFGLTGILAGISTVLALEEISIFAVSTFDTDYILVKTDRVDQAVKALEKMGYHFSD